MKPDTDDYPTCAETYATLRMYHRETGPETVTSALGLEPTEVRRVGETWGESTRVRTATLNGWFLSSEAEVTSFDLSNHLVHILDTLAGKEKMLAKLMTQGWRADIACMWDSAFGHGGPTLSPDLLRRLGELGVEVWFDVYFYGAYELLKEQKKASGGR